MVVKLVHSGPNPLGPGGEEQFQISNSTSFSGSFTSTRRRKKRSKWLLDAVGNRLALLMAGTSVKFSLSNPRVVNALLCGLLSGGQKSLTFVVMFAGHGAVCKLVVSPELHLGRGLA